MKATIRLSRDEIEAIVRKHVCAAMLPANHTIENMQMRYGLDEVEITIGPRDPIAPGLEADAA